MSTWFGFRRLDRVHRILRFQLKGFWGVEQMQEFESAFRTRIDEASALDGGFSVLVDLSEYPAQKEEIQQGHMRCMGYAIEHGMIKSAHLVDAALTDMQMRRMTESVDSSRFGHFQSEQAAL